MENNRKYKILYFLTILIPLILIGVSAFLVYGWIILKIIPLEVAVVFVTLTVLGTGAIRHLRVEYRQRSEEGTERDPTYGYKYKSKRERDIIDMMTYEANEAALSEKEFRGMIKQGSKDPDADLEKLVGIDAVKKRIAELKAEMTYGNKKENDNKGFNMCFLGNPGTGKTTVAGIMAAYLYKYRFLKQNQYIVVDGASLVSSADPSRRINLLLKRSKNKLLFIDEAYALAISPAVGGSVLAVILNEMEADRKRTIVCFAGYKREMKDLFLLNSGLQSRIGTYLFFEDYTNEELLQILTGMLLDKGFEITDEALLKSIDIFNDMRANGAFSNARSARNVAEAAVSRHRLRLMNKETNNEYLIDEEDVFIEEVNMQYFADINF